MPDAVLLNIICSVAAVLISVVVSLYVRAKFYAREVAVFPSVMFIGGGYLAAIAVILLLHRLTAETLAVPDFSNSDFALTVMALALAAVCIQLLVIFLHCHRKKKTVIADGGMFLMTFEFSVLAILLVGMVSARVSQGMTNGRKYLLFFGIVFIVAHLTVILLVNQSEQEAAEQALEEDRHRAQLEQFYYERVKERRQELAGIQSDYNDILTQAFLFMEENQTDQARLLLENLSARVDSTKENQYCRIPVINAVLAEKATECERTGIVLAIDLILPDDLGIKDLDLCMALGNLLDNAIRECGKSPERQRKNPTSKFVEERQKVPMTESGTGALIRLGGRVVQNYLVLRCENPFYSGKSKHPEGTGYGLRILKDLAERYNGDFFTERSDGRFTAQLSLSVSGTGAEFLSDEEPLLSADSDSGVDFDSGAASLSDAADGFDRENGRCSDAECGSL